ncbi:MAG: cyclic nucleotide-binding domain-containing protein [Nitrospirae bacterium]|nr:cyclic nucleotide-binding domain-containing protein [Nitrospirota bacterium]
MEKNIKILVTVSADTQERLVTSALNYMGFTNVILLNDHRNMIGYLIREKCDLVIVDNQTLKADNENLLKAVKAHNSLAKLRVLTIVSDDINVNELKRLYDNGVSSVLKFPFQMNELLKAINDAIRSIPSAVTDTFTKIRKLDFFSFMADEDVYKLLRMAKCRRYKRNDLIFEEGQPGDRFYVIIEGSVSIIKVLGDGLEEVLHTLEPGACFGEMAILENATRSARARSDEDVMLFELDKRIMDGYDDIVTLKVFKKLAYVFSERLRKADSKIKELALYSYSRQ